MNGLNVNCGSFKMKVIVSKSAFNRYLFLLQYNCQQELNSLSPEQNEDPVNLKSNLISPERAFLLLSPSLSYLPPCSLPKEGQLPQLGAVLCLLQVGLDRLPHRQGPLVALEDKSLWFWDHCRKVEARWRIPGGGRDQEGMEEAMG